MRFATVREFRAKTTDYINQEAADCLVVTLHGKPVALVVPIVETEVEELNQAIKAARFRQSLGTLRGQFKKSGKKLPSQRQIGLEIQAHRKSQRS